MSATQIFVVAITAVGLLVAIAIVAVAFRRGGPAATTAELSKRAVRRDRERSREASRAAEEAGATADAPGAVATLAPPEPPSDPLVERTTLTQSEFNLTRRKFFNRSLLAVFGIFLGQFALASLAFGWPKLKGGFGTAINAGKIDELRAQAIQPDGSITPVFVAAAQSWIVPFIGASLDGSSFEGQPVVAGAGDEAGLMAMWQKCVHLGCRVPSCVPSQGFECPCHGSKYNMHGEYEAGPAPRNMDRFGVSVTDTGDFIVDTGNVIATPRAKNKTVAYPQGPFCVG